MHTWASQVGLVIKKSPVNARDTRDTGLILVQRIPWRRARQATPVFFPAKSHGQGHRVRQDRSDLECMQTHITGWVLLPGQEVSSFLPAGTHLSLSFFHSIPSPLPTLPVFSPDRALMTKHPSRARSRG